jgi:hypothetical protein
LSRDFQRKKLKFFKKIFKKHLTNVEVYGIIRMSSKESISNPKSNPKQMGGNYF